MVYFNEELYPIGMSGALFYWKGTVNIKLIGFSISIHSCLKLAYKPYQNLSFPVVAPDHAPLWIVLNTSCMLFDNSSQKSGLLFMFLSPTGQQVQSGEVLHSDVGSISQKF